MISRFPALLGDLETDVSAHFGYRQSEIRSRSGRSLPHREGRRGSRRPGWVNGQGQQGLASPSPRASFSLGCISCRARRTTCRAKFDCSRSGEGFFAMSEYGLPLLATIALWWASTGAIFSVDSLPAGLSSGRLPGRHRSGCFSRSGASWRLQARRPQGPPMAHFPMASSSGAGRSQLLHRLCHRAAQDRLSAGNARGSRDSSKLCAQAFITSWRR